ncbi:hypothetical protein JCM5353_003638 [Sporobolomyces roseus]
MSATSASTSISVGKCVVCGKETWMRCSACSSAGLNWMCFCSIEHQKLIWFMHQRVCGERSNPFCFPGFTSKEVEEMMAYSAKPFPHASTDVLQTWQSLFLDLFGEEEYPPEVAHIDMGEFVVRTLLEAKIGYKPDMQLSSLSLLRRTAHRFLCASMQHEGASRDRAERDAFVANPINYMIDAQETALQGLSHERSEYEPWWTPLQHRYFNMLTILHLMATSTEHDDRLVELVLSFKYLADDLERFLDQVVALANPQVASIFSHFIDHDLEMIVAGVLADRA